MPAIRLERRDRGRLLRADEERCAALPADHRLHLLRHERFPLRAVREVDRRGLSQEPDQGALGVVKRLLDKEDLPKEDRLEFEKLLLEQERHAQDNVTSRWEADMSSDSKLAKNVRPIALIALLGLYLLLAITDSIESIKFEVKEEYVSLLEVLALTAFSAYFAGRSIEKVQYKRKS